MARWHRRVSAFVLLMVCSVAGATDLPAQVAVSPAWAQAEQVGRVIRLGSADIERVTQATDSATAMPSVEVRLSRDAAGRLRDFTTVHVGRVVVIRVDGRTVSRPIIRGPITSGSFVITANMTVQEAQAMAAAFRNGTSAVEFEVAD